MKRHEDTIFIRSRPQCPFPLAVYSLLSSFYFDRNDPYVLPWALASQHFDGWKNRQYSQAYWLLDQLGEWHEDCCGADDDLGLALDWTGEDDLIRFEDV